MKRDVESKLERIFGYPFFQAVGNPLPPSVTAVTNWKRAVKECDGRKWENCRLMARNALQRLVERACWERVQGWDPLAEELRPKIVSFVSNLMSNPRLPMDVPNKIRHKLSWDIMFICLEHEYQDLVRPLFYAPFLDPWYGAGHFPCGWDGEEFPDGWDGVVSQGTLMVF